MEVIRKEVLTVGGLQDQLIGVQVGEFLLVPDSDSGTRPDALRVEGPDGNTLVLHGGSALRVEIHSQGIYRKGFLDQVDSDQTRILSGMASNLPGRVFPASGELLQKKWEAIGEEKIIQSLRKLFKGVDRTLKCINSIKRIPIVGRRWAEQIYPSLD
jgi:hypothetical protein